MMGRKTLQAKLSHMGCDKPRRTLLHDEMSQGLDERKDVTGLVGQNSVVNYLRKNVIGWDE